MRGEENKCGALGAQTVRGEELVHRTCRQRVEVARYNHRLSCGVPTLLGHCLPSNDRLQQQVSG